MRILLAEDDKALCEALKTLFSRENYVTDTAVTGDAGLDAALTNIYDVIVLDVMLPGKDGLSVLREMRGAGIKTPVLMLTARAELEDKISGLDAGADDYLTKPFEAGELLARVRALTRRREEYVDGDLRFGDLRLVRSSGEIVCGGNCVRLGRKELLLLETLISAQGRIVDRETLAGRVWGLDMDTDYNNVEVYVSFVRRKLSFINSSVQIRAARSLGYSLEMPE